MNDIVLTIAPYFMAFLTVCPLLLFALPGNQLERDRRLQSAIDQEEQRQQSENNYPSAHGATS